MGETIKVANLSDLEPGAILAVDVGDERIALFNIDGTIYKKKTVYDFDDDLVEGNLVRPDGEYVAIRKGAAHSSLIKIREHFIPEMLKSAEDI